jgi:hypothetical protein
MGGNTRGRDGSAYKILVGNLNGRDHFINPNVDGIIIIERILKIGCKGANWIHLTQDIAQWQITVNAVIKLRGR